MSTINVRMRAFGHFVVLCRDQHREMYPDVAVNPVEFRRYCGERWRQLTNGQKVKFEELWTKNNKMSVEKNDVEPEPATDEVDSSSKLVATDEGETETKLEVKVSSDESEVAVVEDKTSVELSHKKSKPAVKRGPKESKKGKNKVTKRMKKKDDIKRVRPPYALFLSEMFQKARDSGAAKGGGIQFLVKEAAKAWSELTTEDKQKYVDKCEEDKIRYKREKEEHEKSLLSVSNDVNDSDVEEVVDEL